MTTRTSTNFWLDIVSFVVMIGLAATGGLLHYVLPPGTGHTHSLFGLGRHDYGTIHFYLAVLAVVLLGFHILLHWTWVCCIAAKAAGRAAPSQGTQRAWGLYTLFGVALLLIGGLWWASGMVEEKKRGGGGHRQHASVQSVSVSSL